jgi:hypothetical protein
MKNTPGCFGAASVFAHDSNICRVCKSFDACAVESINTLEQIKGLVNVADLLKRHEVARKAVGLSVTSTVAPEISGKVPTIPEKTPVIVEPVERKTQVENVTFDLCADTTLTLDSLSVKSKAAATQLCKHGLIDKIKAGVQEGRNALTVSKPNYITVAIDSLLSSGFSRSGLRAQYVEKLGWGEATASSHVSIICPILTAFGIAQESNGQFVAAPACAA